MIRTIFFVATAYIAYRTATHVVAENAKPLALLPAPSPNNRPDVLGRETFHETF